MSKGLLIGLTGRKQSGKSTVAKILAVDHNFIERSFAAPIRQFTAELLGLTPDQLEQEKEAPIAWLDGKVSPRQIMQRMGTEFGRQMVHPELWVRRALLGAQGYLDTGRHLVVSDVRFANEATAIRELGGVILHLRRPDADSHTDTHVSEIPLPVKFGDFFVHNLGDIFALEDSVKHVIAQIEAQREVMAAVPGDKL